MKILLIAMAVALTFLAACSSVTCSVLLSQDAMNAPNVSISRCERSTCWMPSSAVDSSANLVLLSDQGTIGGVIAFGPGAYVISSRCKRAITDPLTVTWIRSSGSAASEYWLGPEAS